MRTSRLWSSALILGLLPLAATATNNCNPVGTWAVDVTFAPDTGIPPFHELLSLLPGGVVIENNALLHPNSASVFMGTNGSPGHGAWKRRGNCRIDFKVLKQVFSPAHQFFGFVRITVRARINGDHFSSELGDSNVELVFNEDPDAFAEFSFGASASQGERVKVD